MSDDSSDEAIWESAKFATREAYLLRSFLTYLREWLPEERRAIVRQALADAGSLYLGRLFG